IGAAAEFIAASVRRRVVLSVAEGDTLGPGQLRGGPAKGQPRGRAEMDLPGLPAHLRQPVGPARSQSVQDRDAARQLAGDLSEALRGIDSRGYGGGGGV